MASCQTESCDRDDSEERDSAIATLEPALQRL